MKRNHSMKRSDAFSLVEVALSLGLVSFCLLSVIGLLPIGLQSVRSANDQAAAANAAERIALAIRKATTTDGTLYTASGGFPTIHWSFGDGAASFPLAMTAQGKPATSEVYFKAHVSVIAPENTTSPGYAQISVAWPATAEWSSATGTWTKATGKVGSSIIFYSRP